MRQSQQPEAPADPARRDVWWTCADLADHAGVSTRTVWRLVREGVLPEPHRLTRKLVRWRRAEVEARLADYRRENPKRLPALADRLRSARGPVEKLAELLAGGRPVRVVWDHLRPVAVEVEGTRHRLGGAER